MTKLLLSCMAASVAAAAVSSPKAITYSKAIDNGIPEKSVSIPKTDRKAQTRIATSNVNVTSTAEQRSVKRIQPVSFSKAINPMMKKAPTRVEASGIVFSEDFEGWNGEDLNWIPEGFELRHESGREDAEGWGITPPEAFGGFMGGLTGNCMAINYDSEYLDEWLVFPEVTLGDDMVLSFDAFDDGIWYFSMDNVDWDTYQYIGEKVIAFDQQVMISEDGGSTWKLLKSLADDFMDIDDFEALLAEGTNALRPISVSLADYSGKTVKLAFRYVGKDGNTSAIDNITIGNPKLEVSYANPLGTLFFGMSKESYSLDASFLTGPVYRTMTFENTTYEDDATYSWNYFGPESTWLTADTRDYLDVNYHTDYTDEFSTVNNLYYMPVLNGSAPGFSEGSFTRGKYLQAGGKGQYMAAGQEGQYTLLDLGLSVIDPSAEGSTTVSDALVPVFGYNAETDRFWTEYTFGDEGDEENYSKLTAYMDYFFTSESPMIIRGVHAPAFAQVKEGVHFMAEIIPLSDEGVAMDPIAVAECGYSDLTTIPTGGVNDYISLNFTFAEPIVMSADVCFAYLVRISGFNDPEHVGYFNPMMSAESNPDGYALGWIEKTIVMDGNSRQSMTAVANYIGDMLSFYIMLDAEFPWLEGPSETDNWSEHSTTSVTLDSSTPGSDLIFEDLPEWLTAKAEGQYGNTVVTFYASMTEEIKEDAEVTVKAPGVSHVIKVKSPETSGISSLGNAAEGSEVYNLSGLRVSSIDAPGIYIVKDASGRIRKTTK